MTNPLTHAQAQRRAIEDRLMEETDDGEWLWLCFYRLDRWIRWLEARQ